MRPENGKMAETRLVPKMLGTQVNETPYGRVDKVRG